MNYFRMLPLILFMGALLPSGSNALASGPRTAFDIERRTDDELVSISVHDIDINDFMRGLAQQKRINIITSNDVSGKISVNLYDVPLKQALESICLVNGYQSRMKDNIYYIVKGNNKEKVDPIIGSMVKSFRINYADIKEVRKVVEDVIGKEHVASHPDSKRLIIEDSIDNIRKVEKIIKDVDAPPRQVLIEAKILEIGLEDDFSFGVDWSRAFNTSATSGQASTENFALPRDTEGAQGFFFDVIKTTSGGTFQVFLDALMGQTDVNVLATPQLLALDGKPAEIIIGGKLGYFLVTTTETSTQQSVEFLDIGTQLRLTPHISDDGMILMEIHPEVSDGSVSLIGLPSTSTTEVSTSIIAGHGETILIGGLIRQSKGIVNKRIPLLGSIPLIGPFFGRKTQNEKKSEIVVLITPYLVSAELREIYANKADTVERADSLLQEKQAPLQKFFEYCTMFEKIREGEKKVD